MFSRLRTPVYRNTGSVARDHLASERTLLAWLRTGLGFIALGIAVERFSRLELAQVLPQAKVSGQDDKVAATESSEALVGTLLATGSGSIVYGTSRYFVNLRLLEQGLFKPAYHGPAVLSIAVAGLAGAVYYGTMKTKQKDQQSSSHPASSS